MSDKASIIVRFVASISLLISGVVFNIVKYSWHYDMLNLFASFCTIYGFSLLFLTLTDLRHFHKKGKMPIRDDERSKMITGKSSKNAFITNIVALPILATFFVTNGMHIYLFTVVLIVINVTIFLASTIYYNR